MAKSKGSRSTYVSKGERPNVSRSSVLDGKREYRGSLDELNNKIKAWRARRRVMLTIENPSYDPAEPCNNRFIRVEAKEVWGNPEAPKKKKNG